MTDGILLAELQRDPTCALRHAHHRRGPRAQPEHRLPARLPQALLPRRPDLKLIITSATIDPSASRALRRRAGDRGVRPHLPGGGALPAAPEDGRTTPIDRPDRHAEAVDEIEARARRARRRRRAGVPARRARDPRGGRSSRLRGHRARPTPRCCRCTRGCRPAEQQRVFQPGGRGAHRAGHQRRRDLAHRAGHPLRDRSGTRAHQPLQLPRKVQRLPIEPISQASANQRAGRCGRVGPPGICIRLYSEEDYLAGRVHRRRRSCAPTSRA
jgi:ATP-dependent helicase HrpA